MHGSATAMLTYSDEVVQLTYITLLTSEPRAGPELHIHTEDTTSICASTKGSRDPERLWNPKLKEGRESDTGPSQGESLDCQSSSSRAVSQSCLDKLERGDMCCLIHAAHISTAPGSCQVSAGSGDCRDQDA